MSRTAPCGASRWCHPFRQEARLVSPAVALAEVGWALTVLVIALSAISNVAVAQALWSGRIWATPSSCILTPAGACTVDIAWTSTGFVNPAVYVRAGNDTPKLFSYGPSGTGPAPWITANPLTFELRGGMYPSAQLIAAVTLSGAASGAPGVLATLSATPSLCEVPTLATCTTEIGWTSSGYTSPGIFARQVFGPPVLVNGGTSGSYVADYITAYGDTFEMRAGTAAQDPLLAAITVAGRPPAGSMVGSLLGTPNPCTLSDEGKCATTVTWTSIGASNNPTLFARAGDGPFVPLSDGPQGTYDAPWITEYGVTFELHAGPSLSDPLIGNNLTVKGIKGEPNLAATGTLSASPNPCILSASGLCNTTLTWSSTGSANPSVFVRASDGTPILVSGGATREAVAEWITLQGYTFELHDGPSAQDPTLASVTVTGIPTNCQYLLLTAPPLFEAIGGNGEVSVVANAGCAWSTTAHPDWIKVNTGSGNGNGKVSYTVDENPSSVGRAGSIIIAGQAFTVSQKGASSPQCKVTIMPGFYGNYNETYPGGDGGVGDGGAGAGAGASEGPVYNALVTMTRLADGVEIGRGITDPAYGLVTIRPCVADFPVLLTVIGVDGTKYLNDAIDPPKLQSYETVRHALIDRFDENVSVSLLTDAAYRYALATYTNRPTTVTRQSGSLKSAEIPVGLTAEQVRDVNQIVRTELNRMLPADSRLDSIKSLATPINAVTLDALFGLDRNGKMATVTSGLARMAGNYLPDSADPALVFAEQFARDLTDGKLNGFALDGSPVSSQSGGSEGGSGGDGGAGSGGGGSGEGGGDGANYAPPAYDLVRFPVALTTGMYSVAQRFGATTTFTLGSGLSDLKRTVIPNNTAQAFDVSCYSQVDTFALLANGAVNLQRATSQTPGGCANLEGNVVLIPNFVNGARQIVNTSTNGYVVKSDGTVWAWGDGTCGKLGNGQASGVQQSPVQVLGLTNVTSIAAGGGAVFARDTLGRVWSWGSNSNGLLGTGNVVGIASCRIGSGPAGIGANLVPKVVPTLSNIVSVGYAGGRAFALDVNGRVYAWGELSDTQTAATPVRVNGLPPAIAVSSGGIYIGLPPPIFALTAYGVVYKFDFSGSPQPIDALSDVVEISAQFALKRDGRVVMIEPDSFDQLGVFPFPGVRHIARSGDGSLFATMVDSTYQMISLGNSIIGPRWSASKIDISKLK